LPPHFCENLRGHILRSRGRGAGTAPRFSESQGAGLSMGRGGATGLPPPVAETLLVSQIKAEFPTGASANRAAISTANPSVLPKTRVQSEGGKGNFNLDNPKI
jgi:hypothetical protein